MKLATVFGIWITCLQASVASPPREIILWPEGHPEPRVSSEPAESLVKADDGLTRRFNVSNPRLFVYEPAKETATGAAIVVVPGGGFGRLADEHEGTDVCKWLSSNGVLALQLAYRTPTRQHPVPVLGPVQDLQKAILTIRNGAASFNINPDRIGVLGFSAGGQTALVATAGKSEIGFDGDIKLLRPNAMLLVYPYQVLDSTTKSIRSDIDMDSGMPPTFIAQAVDDKASPPEGSAILFAELVKRSIPAELHIYEKGGHGFGMRPRPGAPGSRDWSDRALDWLRLHEFVASSQN